MNIYVGNLPYTVRDNDLLDLFQTYGNVSSAKVVMDRETDRSKGFGFVEMSSDDEGTNAINKLNGHEINGRALRVNEARPREDRRPVAAAVAAVAVAIAVRSAGEMLRRTDAPRVTRAAGHRPAASAFQMGAGQPRA